MPNKMLPASGSGPFTGSKHNRSRKRVLFLPKRTAADHRAYRNQWIEDTASKDNDSLKEDADIEKADRQINEAPLLDEDDQSP